MKILIAEDDRLTRDGLIEFLESEGYEAIGAADGVEAVNIFRTASPDLVCLDIMMPNQSGYEACRILKAESPALPIIFISAKAEEVDRLVGFDLGADDFIVKPFSIREVLARVRAVARRCYAGQTEDSSEEFQIGDLLVSPNQLRAKRADRIIELSPRDVRILQFLSRHPGKAMERNAIFRFAWGESHFPNSRTLDQHISQLRKRIEVDPKEPKIILTVHGVGYRFDSECSS